MIYFVPMLIGCWLALTIRFCGRSPSSRYGNAITDIIFGVTVPQAKLPVTFPNVDNEQKMTVAQWPGLNSTVWENTKEANYSEGQIVGYRWYVPLEPDNLVGQSLFSRS